MSIQDIINYAIFTNPISANTIHIAKAAASSITSYIEPKQVEVVKMIPPEPLWKLAASVKPLLRIAALSGAAAVSLGAYGSHKTYPDEKGQEQRRVFDTASRYHFIHTLAFLGLPFCKIPYIAGGFFLSGLFLFCGTCYYFSFTGDKKFSKLTPYGGMSFILGWICLFF